MKGPAPQPPDDLNKQETLRDLSYDQTVKGKSDSPVPPLPPPPASPVPSTRRLDQAPTVRVPGAHPPAPEPTASPGDKLKPGQRMFQRYRLVRFLGRGAMGLVWLARDEALEIDVALKFLPDALAGDKRSVHALKEEVKRARGLTHRNIIQVFDFNQDEERVGMSMEYVDGETLSAMQLDKERHPGGVFTLRVLRPWVGQLCEALEYAHQEARVVHRDLKPSNLMVSKAGHLKVADFGISRSIAECLTRTTHGQGTKVSGTPPYMSPEHLEGDKPHPTNDIYSLGATLYELLTGQPPFSGGDIPTQIKSKKPLPLRQRREEWLQSQKVALREKLPDEWEETIMDCLAKKAADRPQSAREVAERLGLFETPDGTPRRKRRRWPWALLMGLLVLLGVGGWVAAKQGKLEVPREITDPRGQVSTITYWVNDQLAPATNMVLKLGSNKVIVERQDYESTTNRLWLLPLMKKPLGSVTLPKQRSMGILEIKAPAGFSWKIESKRGETNVSGAGPREVDLPTGDYALRITGPSGTAERSFTIDRHGRTSHEAQVSVPINARLDESWEIRDLRGTVIDNGVGQRKVTLQQGIKYALRMIPKGGVPATASLDPQAGPIQELPRGRVQLSVIPANVASGFEIRLQNGTEKIAGTSSPTNLPLFIGAYVATAANQYGSTNQQFTIEADETQNVELVLPRPPPPPGPVESKATNQPPGAPTTVSPVINPGQPKEEVPRTKAQGPNTGGLIVITDPPGLRFSMASADGFVTNAIAGEGRLLSGLKPGRYSLYITNELGVAQAEPIVVAGQTNTQRVVMKYGRVNLTTTPRGGTVFLVVGQGTRLVGLAPCLSEPLAEGQHRFMVTLPGFATNLCTVSVLAGRTNNQPLTLTALGVVPPPPKHGQSWRNSLGMEFVPVPGLDYLLFGKYEVRIGDFQQFMKAETGHQYNWPYTSATNLDYPAAKVSWVMATKFCQWLTTRERNAGRIGAGQSYDLPSDFEWSIAAGFKPDARPPATPRDRSADRQNDSYPFGTWRADLQPPPDRAGNYLGAPKVPGDEFAGASPVGRFLPAMLFSRGAIPVYDLGGNVKEWVLDFHEDAQSRRRTLRGGSFRTSITDGLISQRESSPESDDSHDDVGFRCVVILDWNVMLDSRARDQAGRILRPLSR